MNVFVCVDVLTYLHSTAEPVKQRRTAEWLALLAREGRGRTSMQELSEYYLFLTQKKAVPLPAAHAWKEAGALMAWRPQPLDEALMTRAHEIEHRHRLSWRESLMVAGAQLQDCTALLTEELPDGRAFGTVRVRNPFLHGIGEPEAEYLAIAA